MNIQEQLQQQLHELNNSNSLTDESPQFKIWYEDTLQILKNNFEESYVNIFSNIFASNSTVLLDLDTYSDTKKHLDNTRKARAFLQTMLNKKANSTLKKINIQNYDLHNRIQKVSSRQFKNNHFKEAILNAFIEVIIRVKEVAKYPVDKNGKELDGDTLMNQVFSCDGNANPVIKLNELKNSLDKAEQRGFMYLYKGICGIRDKKAHLNFLQKDPNKTIEYLSLASLLMRLLDDNYLKKFNQ